MVMALGTYITLNPCRRDLLARSCNKTKPWAENTTGDVEILRRRFFLIDCDAVRPTGISSTDQEHRKSLEVTRQIRSYLCNELGWPQLLTPTRVMVDTF